VLLADRDFDFAKVRGDLECRDTLRLISMSTDPKLRKVVDVAIYTLDNMVEGYLSKLRNCNRLAAF